MNEHDDLSRALHDLVDHQSVGDAPVPELLRRGRSAARARVAGRTATALGAVAVVGVGTAVAVAGTGNPAPHQTAKHPAAAVVYPRFHCASPCSRVTGDNPASDDRPRISDKPSAGCQIDESVRCIAMRVPAFAAEEAARACDIGELQFIETVEHRGAFKGTILRRQSECLDNGQWRHFRSGQSLRALAAYAIKAVAHVVIRSLDEMENPNPAFASGVDLLAWSNDDERLREVDEPMLVRTHVLEIIFFGIGGQHPSSRTGNRRGVNEDALPLEAIITARCDQLAISFWRAVISI